MLEGKQPLAVVRAGFVVVTLCGSVWTSSELMTACVLLIVLKSKPPAPKRELLLPVNNSSKENGVRVEQDDQDLFAGESASLTPYWCFLNCKLRVICVLAMICLCLGCLL